MNATPPLRVCLVGTVLLLGLVGVARIAHADETVSPVEFNPHIRPILSDTCFHCHGFDPSKRKAGLRLDNFEGATRVTQDHQAIKPGDLKASDLWQRINSTSADTQMPPPDSGKKLTPKQVAMLGRWIEQGATYQKHWAFETPRRPPLPAVQQKNWPRNDLDRFILARMEADQLKPSAEADKPTLLRRVTLDLTGLPPTPEAVAAFLTDKTPSAYEHLVDQLLESPRYGEHFARYWLDAARYGDTHGLHLDNERSIWPYRDWVVAAFNRNLAFDQFTIEQVAGDLLPNPTRGQLTASGFNRCNSTTSEGGAIDEEFRVRYAVDRVETTSAVWLGLTMGCAVCHDHKLDPITQKEFYQLFSIFNNTSENAMDGNALLPAPTLPVPSPEQEEKLAGLTQDLTNLEKQLKESEAGLKGPDAEQTLAPIRETMKSKRDQRAALEKEIPATLITKELDKPRPAWVLLRGAYDKHGDAVSPGVPSILPPLPQGEPANRLTFARWLVAPEHPLTARVNVNRFWQQFFGTGLVKTANDFGSKGEWPSHPDLLDWLATEFIRNGWDVKQLARLIITSATYRQDSRTRPELLDKDPENRLLARGPRFRLDGEVLRDNALFVSGLLDLKMGGRGVRPYQPPGIWEAVGYTTSNTAKYQQDHGDALYRRSLYLFWKRTAPPPSMTTFDAPSRESCSVRRERTNTPLQALLLLNDPQYLEAARHLGHRMWLHGGTHDAERLRFGFRCVTAREPDAKEQAVLERYLTSNRQHYEANTEAAKQLLGVGESPIPNDLPPAELAAYTMLASLLLNLDEVVTKN